MYRVVALVQAAFLPALFFLLFYLFIFLFFFGRFPCDCRRIPVQLVSFKFNQGIGTNPDSTQLFQPFNFVGPTYFAALLFQG